MSIPDSHPAFELIGRFVEQQMEQDRIPGLALAITDRERTLHLATYGYANLDSKEAITPEHLFEIGSITKSFTAIALLQLHEEGSLDLHAPVTDYLPWFKVKSGFEPITVHHLLTHTAGIIGVNDVLTDKLYDVWALRNTAPPWGPGSRFHYSNVAYKALTLLLERIEGKDFGAITRQRILGPLSMTNTEPVTTHEIRRRLATGYLHFYDDRPWLPHHGMVQAEWLEIATGDGCIAMPPEELAAYLRALMNRGHSLLREDSFNLLTSKFIEVEPNHWYGYGLDRDEIDGHTVISHGGEMPGYFCYMLADLDTGLGVIIQINGVSQLFNTILFARQALSAAVENQPLPELPPLVDRRVIERAGEYAGSYRSSVGGEEHAFELIDEDQSLYMNYNGMSVPLWKIGEASFVADHPDFCRLPLRFIGTSEPERTIRHGSARFHRIEDEWGQHARAAINPESSPPVDKRGKLAGHYRTFNATFTNFRIIESPTGEILLVHPSGKEEALRRIDQSTWRVEDTPETVSFDTFVDGQALRASFSGCNYYRAFTD